MITYFFLDHQIIQCSLDYMVINKIFVGKSSKMMAAKTIYNRMFLKCFMYTVY